MNPAVILVIAVIAVVLVFGIRKTLKTVKGGCCGGGGGDLEPLKKELEGEVVSEKVLKIDGMHCRNCQYRVQRALERIDGVASEVNFKKNQAIVKMDREVPDVRLESAVKNQGYSVSGIETVPVA